MQFNAPKTKRFIYYTVLGVQYLQFQIQILLFPHLYVYMCRQIFVFLEKHKIDSKVASCGLNKTFEHI